MPGPFAVDPDSQCLKCADLRNYPWPGFEWSNFVCDARECKHWEEIHKKKEESHERKTDPAT
ncbi:MAG: hypothetical protein A2293_17090 [Elusimicrobia bacterium RIFOXYB2_FULL_49_7]|nr:MAG: hypothetical protein A2293_17090 [Elusimicrobia bacterium RIFOXYB2_FULL_49_7]